MKRISGFIKFFPYFFLALFILAVLFLFKIDVGVMEIREVVPRAGIFGPVVFIFLHSLTYIFAPISGMPFFLSGYALFGKTFIFYSYLAVLIGVVVNFWLSRIWGKSLVNHLVGAENMKKIESFTSNFGVKTLIFLRLLQGNVADYISYGYGLTNIKFLTYFLISAVAPLPGLFVWYLILLPHIRDYEDFLLVSGISFIPGVLITVIISLRFLISRKKSH